MIATLAALAVLMPQLPTATRRSSGPKLVLEVALGNLMFRVSPHRAMRHDEVGVRIGELSLGDGFDGALGWGLIDNRPFLRCLHGYGLSLWRLERFGEAERVFERMLWLDPTDNQGARFVLRHVRARRPWVDDEPRRAATTSPG